MTRLSVSALIALSTFLLAGTFGCSPFDESDSDEGGVTHRVKDVSGRLAVALGGSAPGVDTIVIDEPFTTLEFQNHDADLFDLEA